VRLKVLLPTHIAIDCEVEKVTAEAENGSFCLLPKHIDFAASLVPGILIYEQAGKGEKFVAIDEGVLVKRQDDVFVSSRDAILGDELERLSNQVQEEFTIKKEDRKKAETALAKMEANFVNNFMQLNKYD
jgi:F-type H+-transporting ATPase subunit epsilon